MNIANYIDDFTTSQHFQFMAPEVKEHAASLLYAFTKECENAGASDPENLTVKTFDDILQCRLARLDLPLDVKRAIPSLLSGFFAYLASSGHYPPAAAWVSWVLTIDKKYQSKFRDDGSVKGETFKKNYTDMNRNDPCPCGSGKKFKKCCLGLM